MAQQLNQPTQLEPIGTWGSKDVPVQMTGVWYKFFLSVSVALSNFAGAAIGYSLDNAVAATGGTQATAAKLSTEWASVVAGGLGTGVVLNNFGPGTTTTVFNRSGSAKNLYPPAGGNIDSLAVNSPYSLANGKMQTFHQVGNSSYISTQLG